jgi:aryl-alcohol dehydrogenase-like predicted oxidoreductase
MSYGESGLGTHAWSMGIDESRPFFRQAIEAGITTFDTANVYSLGSSEEFTGQLLREFTVHGRMFPGAKGGGLSRAAILTAVDDSLRRLGTDYIDLYQIHRWDPLVPIEETMETLHDIVRAGKARYIGASSMWAWQFATAQYTADVNGWTRFVSMQDQYNLLQREEEREMHPFCLDQGVGVIPWSPLARGSLTRPWGTETSRTGTDAVLAKLYHEESNHQIVDAVASIAAEHGVSAAQVALAWVLQRPVVTAPIVGATKPSHLADAVAALEVQLSADEVTRLEEHYTPLAPSGF